MVGIFHGISPISGHIDTAHGSHGSSHRVNVMQPISSNGKGFMYPEKWKIFVQTSSQIQSMFSGSV